MQEAITYPFSAIVSLADLKLALILNAINPKIGGLLIRGPKGSGKTTAVRALADILPKIKVVKGCSFNCNPEDPSNMCEKCRNPYMKDGKLPFEERKMRIIDLPLGATEDRVVGSLDVEKVIKMGIEALELGILAQANQNILYVDEVNLLPDHIADDLLDAAATGWNVVEREGISIKHPSRFIFIGTMNPEEGHLRPQLLDRFPLCVEVKRISDVKDRIEIVKRNMEFEVDPERFVEKYGVHLEKLKSKIIQAKKILSEVEVSEKLVAVICEACLELKVDGMRPDIVIAKTAKTLAAFENKAAVALEHILKSAELALNHRTREGGFLEPATPDEIKKTFMDKVKEVGYEEKDKSRSKPKIETKKGIRKKRRVFFWPKKISEKREVSPDRRLKKPVKRFKKAIFTLDKLLRGAISSFKKHEAPKEARALNGVSSAKPRQLTEGVPLFTKIKASILAPFEFFFKIEKTPRGVRSSVGKRAETVTTLHRGRPCGWRFPEGKPRDIHLPATIRAAARMQRFRGIPSKIALDIHFEDVREKLRIYRAPMTIIFVLDLSKSMLHSIDEVKKAMLKLHNDAYRYRDKVGIVALKDMGAVVVQHPTTNLRLVANKLLRLRMSGFTPLAAGMLKALEVLKEAKRRDLSTIPAMVILTDGEANVPLRRNLQTGEIRESDALDAAFFRYEDEAIKDVILVSEMIKRESIYTVVINTTLTLTGVPTTSGSITTRMIASITNGIHHEASRSIIKRGQKPAEEISDAILQAQRHISHTHYLTCKQE
ncbi:MAG: VWA domain-containing protein [Candidatus Bathyarchaeota archaeon]|nr:VWA domain-containing protein [Candidatus Bathyarchaeota archaeon]